MKAFFLVPVVCSGSGTYVLRLTNPQDGFLEGEFIR